MSGLGTSRAAGAALAAAVALAASGCLSWAAASADSEGSIGTVTRGVLVGAECLPRSSDHFRFYRRTGHRCGTPELAGMVERTADRLADQAPGTVLLVGDMSRERGGFVADHRSHRSGRDVDFAFFLTDATGATSSGHPLARIDRFGVGERDGSAVRFDDRRNWLLVEDLLTDPGVDVQWVFVSRGLKARLLGWALENGRDPEILERAARVLHQPGDGAPHDDHFHVRIYCPRGPAGGRCEDLGPTWPWVERRSGGSGTSDEDLVRLALEPAGS